MQLELLKTNQILTVDEYELISEGLSVYADTLNDGKGITLINRQVGRLLAKLETLLPDED
mgnify:FL=1|tara:strand:+ start:190 stop:369 length:180 start_codon:yes stop_codon:yes gene_type:complete